MVQLRVQSISCLVISQSQMDTPDVIEITNKMVYGVLSKMHLRMQMDAISSQLKNGS